MKTLPTANELESAFTDFARFTIELLEMIELKPSYLKFAAINSQIALELFLKYLYVKTGKADEIQKKKKGQIENDFVDFAQILSHFYSSQKGSYGKKRELEKLIDTRNSIVHRGQRSTWDSELATIVVRTLFFIHATAWSELGETLLYDNNLPHKISENKIWREGVKSFVSDLIDNFDATPRMCLSCYTQSVVSGEVIGLEKDHCEEHLVCLNCLTAIDTSHNARLIECYVCHEKAYLVDAFNEQDNQLHVAKCSECETDTWVRMCHNCEEFYHPSASEEVEMNGSFFCCSICAEYHEENQA